MRNLAPGGRTRALTLCGLSAALTAVGALISIKLPPPLVPITLQILFTLLAGVLLGSRLGALSQLVYVSLGLVGLPVFAGGSGGLQAVLRPTFGYLIGFIACAWLTGTIVERQAERRRPTVPVIFLAALAGVAADYVLGVGYLYLIRHVYLGQTFSLVTALRVGALLPLPGDLLKCAATAVIGARLVPKLANWSA